MDKLEATIRFENNKKRQEALEHQNTLLAISSILKTKEGLQFFNYLFKNFEVASVPPMGMQGLDLHEYLGFLRAGNSVYKLACEANSEIAASILAKQEREKNADQYELYRIENGLYDDTASDDNT